MIQRLAVELDIEFGITGLSKLRVDCCGKEDCYYEEDDGASVFWHYSSLIEELVSAEVGLGNCHSKNRPEWGGSFCFAKFLAMLESVAIEFRFFCFTAFGATLRFILKSIFLVELLLAFGEDEFFVAVLADNSFVWHGFSYVFSGSNILGLSRKTRKRHLGMLNRF
jgi:hypothetical protein